MRSRWQPNIQIGVHDDLGCKQIETSLVESLLLIFVAPIGLREILTQYHLLQVACVMGIILCCKPQSDSLLSIFVLITLGLTGMGEVPHALPTSPGMPLLSHP